MVVRKECLNGEQRTIRAYNTKTGEDVFYNRGIDTVYGYIDKFTRGKIIWKDFSFIDTDTGKERSGVYWDENAKEMKGCLYLETIAQYHREAKKLLGDKDQHGMRLNGIIILINGEEPGQGKTSLFDYRINPGDVIEIVYKNDAARYNSSTSVSSMALMGLLPFFGKVNENIRTM